MGDYRKPEVSARAHRLTLDVYLASKAFPKEEIYGLTSQIRRAASSIPANIAEGYGRNGDSGLARFLAIALGSANELDYHLPHVRDLDLLANPDYERLAAEAQVVAKMPSPLIQRLRSSR